MNRQAYVSQLSGREDEQLRHVREDIIARGMPSISVMPDLGRLLEMLVRTSGATRVLEIGALGGYSGICLARGLSPEGRLLSLELDPDFADAAQANLTRAGLGDKVEYRIGQALDSLQQLIHEGKRFDFFFIDADKENYPNYLEAALALADSGAVICADNVLLGDRVPDESNHDPSVIAMRRFNETLCHHPRLQSVILPVHDGFAIATVLSGE